MATATPRWCEQCGRLVWHRLAHGMCNACYAADRHAHGPRDPDPQQAAWADTRPKLNTATADWAAGAACRGLNPNLFFPDDGDHTTAQQAKAVCVACPAADGCLQYALTNRIDHGVWGGLDVDERKRHRRRNQRRTAA